jgi:hypothetical protein
MQSLLGKLSLGYVADRMAAIVRWSPLGRELQLQDAEGPQAAMFEGLAGKVISWDDGVIVIDCPDRPGPGPHKVTSVRLTPRHSGWTGRSLMLLPIAVVALTTGHDGASKQAVAIARIK